MDIKQAQKIIREVFEKPFEKEKFTSFIRELLNKMEPASFTNQGNYIPDAYKPYISSLERIGKYNDGEHDIDVLIVRLKKETSLERARTMQRNFIARYLNGSRGGNLKDAALVAFVSPDKDDWRFSLVKMDYRFEEGKNGKVKVKEEFTPARRWSFLVGGNEASHTAQSRLVPILADDEHNPVLEQLEEAFDIETVTKEFFIEYRNLFIRIKEAMDTVIKNDAKIKKDFNAKGVDTVNFTKKLLGQIVFLYFLQKKGWFGVQRDEEWGTGSKQFLRDLFQGEHGKYKNFFNDILEPLFYEALRIDRRHDDDYYSHFNCKIPFLNGGLFDPIGNYDWVHTDIIIPNELFSNDIKTKNGDTGNGILDIFDRYNFTVKEDEPLEKDVAIDPELLGKAYEKFNAIRPDNFDEYKAALQSGQKGAESKFNKKFGVYYTPREIVHYMCQQSLINYLTTELDGKVKKEEIETLVHFGEQVGENEVAYLAREQNINEGKQKSTTYISKLPDNIRHNAELVDTALANITVCDPAVGSGAFPVGMMHEIVKIRNLLNDVYIKDKNKTVYDFKRECIENSLYGVDIDPGAVEIAKLRLWLSMIVDEDDIRQIKPLPNLDYKIVCGNSLLSVEIDLFNEGLFSELEKLKPLHLNEISPANKQEYQKKIDELISQITNGHTEFDFKVYFSEVFHEKRGFYVVIANPPYLSALDFSKIYGKEEREALNILFQSAKGTYDLYILFIERAITLLNSHGNLAFINPNKYLSAKYAEALRNFILANAQLDCLVDVSGIRVFDEASVYPVLSFICKRNKSSYNVKLLHPKIRQAEHFEIYNYNVNRASSNVLSALPETIWGFLLSDKISLLLKLMDGTKPMSQFGDINASTTAAEADEYSEQISDKKKINSVKVINTGLIDPYVCNWEKISLKIKNKKYRAPYLSLRLVNKRRKNMYTSPKVIYAKLSKRCEAFLDIKGEYASLNTNVFYNPHKYVSLRYIAAFSNSKLFMFFYDQFFGSLRMGGGFYQFQSPQLRVIPCRLPTLRTSKNFDLLVDKILTITEDEDYLEKTTKQTKVREYEKQIDQLVYKLYGLTQEEIKVIENYGR